MRLEPFHLVSSGSIALLVIAHMQEIFPLAAPASLAVFVIVHAMEFRLHVRTPWPVMLAVSFIVYALFLLVVHNVLRDYSLMQTLRNNSRIIYMLSIFLVFAYVRPRRVIEFTLFRAALYSTGLICLTSIFSRFVSPITISENRLSTERSLLGLLGNHNAMAGLLGSVLILSMVAWGHQVRFPNRRLLTLPALAALSLVVFGFALSLSRSYTLAMAIGGLFFTTRIPSRRLRHFWIAGAVLGAVSILVFVFVNRSSDADADNIDTRIALYRRAAETIRQSPILGIGPGAFEELHVSYNTVVPHLLAFRHSGRQAIEKDYHDVRGTGGVHVHNSYLQFLCDFGIAGILLFSSIFWASYSRFFNVVEYQQFATSSDTEDIWELADWNASVVLFTMIFLAVAAMFSGYTFTSPPLTLVLYASLGRLASHTEFLLRTRPSAQFAV